MPSSMILQKLLHMWTILSVLFFTITTPVASTTSSSSSNSTSVIAKEGCRDRCGEVSIPYPFGIGSSHCYHNEAFEIKCNDSHNPPSPFLPHMWDHSYQVLQLTLDYVRVRVLVPPADCYNQSIGESIEALPSIPDLYGSHFSFSHTRNKLTAVGCGIFTYIKNQDTRNYSSSGTGCASFCANEKLGNLNSCLGGNGCCQTSIPEGLQYVDTRMVFIQTYNRTWIPGRYCGHALLVEHDFTGLNKLNLISGRGDTYAPVILDWAIFDIGEYITSSTCKKAQRNSTSYACGKNTDCIDSKAIGYNCKCSKGYRGNPYLHGCQDIDECKESNTCGEELTCINIQGSYKCGCPPDKNLELDDLGKMYCTPRKQRLPVVVIVSSGIGIGTVIILLFAMGFWMYHRLKKRKQLILKQKHFKRNGGLLLKQKISSNNGRVEKAAKIFVTEELEKATDNFNRSRIIGKGGFGTVYKGMLADGRIVAIKKSKLVDESQIDQFINEVVILSQINHRHIIKILGCCLETQVPLLVYEFVSNGTLSYHLHGAGDHESTISWNNRLRIAVEIAGALSYLHSDASIPIFHRDIKSTNILLDENYKAKVSDFGISRSVPLDKTHLTTLVQGTFGYLDPEYFHSSQFTEKSDVYSFGVVLVELLTGEKAISPIRSEEEKSLALYFISALKENRLFDILEAQVVNEENKNEILVVAKLAKRCLKLNGKKRPTMREVAISLNGLRKFVDNPWVDKPKTQKEEDCTIGDELLHKWYKEYEGSESNRLIVVNTI